MVRVGILILNVSKIFQGYKARKVGYEGYIIFLRNFTTIKVVE